MYVFYCHGPKFPTVVRCGVTGSSSPYGPNPGGVTGASRPNGPNCMYKSAGLGMSLTCRLLFICSIMFAAVALIFLTCSTSFGL